MTAGASGSGNGTVGFSAAANAEHEPRTGTLTIGGPDVHGDAGGRGCTYAIAPTSQSVVAGGGTGSTSVTAPAGCAWTARQQRHDLADGDDRRERQRQRHGQLQCGGQREHEPAHRHAHDRRPDVHGDAGGRIVCTSAISPTSQSVVASGRQRDRRPSRRPPGCAWTAVSSNATWMTVTAGATRHGQRHGRLHGRANAARAQRARARSRSPARRSRSRRPPTPAATSWRREPTLVVRRRRRGSIGVTAAGRMRVEWRRANAAGSPSAARRQRLPGLQATAVQPNTGARSSGTVTHGGRRSSR